MFQVFTVDSKKAATFTVEFQPHELGSFSHELHLRVNNNPFEQYKVALTGMALNVAHAGWWFLQHGRVVHMMILVATMWGCHFNCDTRGRML